MMDHKKDKKTDTSTVDKKKTGKVKRGRERFTLAVSKKGPATHGKS